MKKENLKFCINCKYYFYDVQEDCELCSHPNNVKSQINLVSGKPLTLIYINTPSYLRHDKKGGCGKSAKWYEQKESSLD